MNQFIPQAQLDFHEYGELLAFDIEHILETFIEDSYFSDLQYLLIITGKGHVVRPMVEKLLKENNYVNECKPAGYFNGQSGAFEVVLID